MTRYQSGLMAKSAKLRIRGFKSLPGHLNGFVAQLEEANALGALK